MIELAGISKIYADGKQALDSVALDVGEGVVGLLGPNGAGKTTLLEILTLALEPSAGRRSYFGLSDAIRHRARIRSGIGYLPQEYTPIRSLTGLEYLVLAGEVRELPLGRRALERRALRLLEAVELADAARRSTGTYSGGMTRRLGLAQALLHSPRFLVVDEPTAGLDPEERIRFRNIVTDVGDRIPVLLSTHIVEDIEATCPRICILAEGRLRFDEAPAALLELARGRLWGRTGGAPERKEGEVSIGHRTTADGARLDVLVAEEAPAGAVPITATLEEAYAAFLASSAAPGSEVSAA